jgi:hypothetical protein
VVRTASGRGVVVSTFTTATAGGAIVIGAAQQEPMHVQPW